MIDIFHLSMTQMQLCFSSFMFCGATVLLFRIGSQRRL
jgi:hypothetical protein